MTGAHLRHQPQLPAAGFTSHHLHPQHHSASSINKCVSLTGKDLVYFNLAIVLSSERANVNSVLHVIQGPVLAPFPHCLKSKSRARQGSMSLRPVESIMPPPHILFLIAGVNCAC